MMASPELAAAQDAAGAAADDVWYDWLLHTRHGGDGGYAAFLAALLGDIRGRLLDHARLRPADAIADIGCGDGFAAFGALERHPDATATLIDISPALIEHARARSRECGLERRCTFLVASAESLAAVADASVDVVLVRSVLAYLDRKADALGEFRRILRPGGRISIVDPIFQDNAFAIAGLARHERTAASDPVARLGELIHRFRSAHYPDSLDAIRSSSLTNYNERDLLRFFELAGFVNIHLRLHIDSVPAPAISWEAFLASAPRAGVPTVGEILDARFSAQERLEFEQLFRAGIELGGVAERNVNAYIYADAP